MLKELAVERLRFSCGRCRRSWQADYDVQHLEDAEGEVFEYYSLNGVPVEVPTAPGSVTCPQCGRWTRVELLARRPVPVLSEQSNAPRRRRAPNHGARARNVPLLSGSDDESTAAITEAGSVNTPSASH